MSSSPSGASKFWRRGLSLYLVTGRLPFRGYLPGETFEALIERDAEERAVARGNVRVLERGTPQIRPDSFVLPVGWQSTRTRSN